MFTIPWTLEVPFIINGITLSHVVDLDCLLEFDADGDMTAVTCREVRVERSDKSDNARAIWTAAADVIAANRHLRLLIETRANGNNSDWDNSPAALRRELGHSQRELV